MTDWLVHNYVSRWIQNVGSKAGAFRTICILIFLQVLVACQFHSSSLKAYASVPNATTVQFDPANNMIVVKATLNGEGPYRFLVDTGASSHVIKPELAQKLGLVAGVSGAIDAGGGATVEAGTVRVDTVQIGNVRLVNQQFFVIPFPSAYMFDGFLGADLFRAFVVTIDFRSSQLTFIAPGAFEYGGEGKAVSMQFYKGLIPKVNLKVDQDSGWFKLDTGYNGSLAFFGEFIKRHRLLTKYAPVKQRPGGQTLTGGLGDTLVAQAGKVRVGEFELEKVEAAFFTEKKGSNAAFSGAIGTVFLNHFKVVVDYSRKRLFLEVP
jgi:hypothetical protein